MSDNPDFPQSEYDAMGEDSPFIDWSGWDLISAEEDPHGGIERDVLDALGIASFDEIFVNIADRNFENARGNRFETITEAIVYLFDAGILQFSGVVIGDEIDDFVEIDVDDCTQPPC